MQEIFIIKGTEMANQFTTKLEGRKGLKVTPGPRRGTVWVTRSHATPGGYVADHVTSEKTGKTNGDARIINTEELSAFAAEHIHNPDWETTA